MFYFRRWVTYMNLDTMSGFHHESDTPYQTNDMRFVKTDPYHFMLIGGNTPNWAGTSTANWFRWNDANSRCFDSQKAKNVTHRNCRVVRAEADMLYSHLNAPAVAVPVTKARIKSCAEPYALPPP